MQCLLPSKNSFSENFHSTEKNFLFWIFFFKLYLLNSSNLGKLTLQNLMYFFVTSYGWYCVQILKFFEKINVLIRTKNKKIFKIFKIFFFLKSNSVFFLFWNFEFFQEITKYWSYFSKKNLKCKTFFHFIFRDSFMKWSSVYIKNNPLIDLKFFQIHGLFIKKQLAKIQILNNFHEWKFFFFNFYFIITKATHFFNYGKYLEKTWQKKLKFRDQSVTLNNLTDFLKRYKCYFSENPSEIVKKTEKKKIWLLQKKKLFLKKSTLIRKKKN